jgi:transposase-like protein
MVRLQDHTTTGDHPMRSVLPEQRRVNGYTLFEGAIADTHHALLEQLGQEIGERINAAAAYVLGRAPYVRRGHVPYSLEQTRTCPQCHSVQSQRFSRNGSRRRHLLTRWGEVRLRWPRFVCECGGSITLDLDDWLRPYQRLGSDVDAQIQRWGALSVSLRGMQGELAHSYMGVLGLRTLLQRLHQLQNLTPGADERCTPPILQLDAIWFTQLCATGQWRTDAKGRRRPVKSRRKRCLLIALGVWPESDYQEVLAWHLADSEDAASWLAFLSQLEEQGIRGANGLELIIHDGGSGLCSALTTIHFDAIEQRCLFHKLRNIWQAIHVAEDLPVAERKRQRRAIFRDFVAIFQAQQRSTVLRRALKVVQQYRETQPDAVATLRRDFRATLAYFLIQARHPTWRRRYLRTTSRLERFNRPLRRRIRSANAYHSDAGVLAMIAQEVDRTIPLPSQRNQRTHFQPKAIH